MSGVEVTEDARGRMKSREGEKEKREGHKSRLGQRGMPASMCGGAEMIGSGRLCVN